MERRKKAGTAAWSLIILAAGLQRLAASQPVTTDMLKALNLSSYPSAVRPPAFTARTIEGEVVSLAVLRGKVGLLNFWATWCQECRPDMALLERLHREFAAQGLVVLGINVREQSLAVRKYAKELGLTFPLVLDPKGELSGAYGVVGIPTTFLVGRDGRAVALAVGPRDWGGETARSLIRALLAEAVALKGTR